VSKRKRIKPVSTVLSRAPLGLAAPLIRVEVHLGSGLPIVVEAAAPVHSAPTGQSPPGGASVDLLSVKYHVHLGNLDLTKHADVVALQDKITEAAKKGCKDIQNQYPLRPMSDGGFLRETSGRQCDGQG
jgi:hypothetical protein